MSVISIEREQCEFPINGANALKPEPVFQPQLRLVPNSETEFIPKPIISLPEYRERKKREQIMNAPVLVIPEVVKKETPKLKTESRPELISGFSIADETRSVTRVYDAARTNGLSHDQAFDKAWKDHEGNLVRYHFEYTMRFPVLVNPVALNEQGYFVNADSGRRLADMTSADERNGAVRQSVVRTEQLLKDAKEGEIVVAPSPRGGTGKYIEGKELVYGETELFFYEKLSEQEIRALTFVVDLSYEQVLQVCKFFITPDSSISDLSLPEKQRIESMVSNPFIIPAGVTSAHEFLNTVQDVQGGDIMRKANGADRTFDQGHELIDLEDDLKLLPKRVQAARGIYKDYLKKNINHSGDAKIFELIQDKMQLSLLEDIKIIEGKVEENSPQVSVNYRRAMSSDHKIDVSFVEKHYAEQMYFMRTKMVGLGCNNPSEGGSGIFGQSLSEIIGGYSSGGGGGIGEASSGLAPKCIKCRKELCEGRCFNCEKRASRAA